MKKVQKGEYGYIHSQKICRSFITFILLLIPVVIFFIGLAIYHKRENMFTFVGHPWAACRAAAMPWA